MTTMTKRAKAHGSRHCDDGCAVGFRCHKCGHYVIVRADDPCPFCTRERAAARIKAAEERRETAEAVAALLQPNGVKADDFATL